MKINDLLDQQDKMTGENQLVYQAIIKKHLKKYGLDRSKDKILNKELEKHADKLVKNALKLGSKWLA